MRRAMPQIWRQRRSQNREPRESRRPEWGTAGTPARLLRPCADRGARVRSPCSGSLQRSRASGASPHADRNPGFRNGSWGMDRQRRLWLLKELQQVRGVVVLDFRFVVERIVIRGFQHLLATMAQLLAYELLPPRIVQFALPRRFF